MYSFSLAFFRSSLWLRVYVFGGIPDWVILTGGVQYLEEFYGGIRDLWLAAGSGVKIKKKWKWNAGFGQKQCSKTVNSWSGSGIWRWPWPNLEENPGQKDNRTNVKQQSFTTPVNHSGSCKLFAIRMAKLQKIILLSK